MMDFLLHRVDGVVERNFWAVQAGTELLSDLLLHESSTVTLFKQLAAPMRKKDLKIINLCLSSLLATDVCGCRRQKKITDRKKEH